MPELILGRSALQGLLPLCYQTVFDYREKNPLQHSISASKCNIKVTPVENCGGVLMIAYRCLSDKGTKSIQGKVSHFWSL